MVVETCKTMHYRIINIAGLLVTELYTMKTYLLTACNSVKSQLFVSFTLTKMSTMMTFFSLNIIRVFYIY